MVQPVRKYTNCKRKIMGWAMPERQNGDRQETISQKEPRKCKDLLQQREFSFYDILTLSSSGTTLVSCENYRANAGDTTLVSCADKSVLPVPNEKIPIKRADGVVLIVVNNLTPDNAGLTHRCRPNEKFPVSP
ncbi:hypothetical protein WN48_09037 [Eufriesea mexicana]|nr:hypothetical protein WN48_09037 [Eufriesea mexicana]